MTQEIKIKWSELLHKAVTEKGMINTAYQSFYGYSIGNQLYAMMQCMSRGIPAGPIATFKAWQAKDRFVKSGSKAIALCMPVTMKTEVKNKTTGETEEKSFARFILRNNWFVLSQTEGKDVEMPVIPEWNKETALTKLSIKEIAFDHMNGNVMGFARLRDVAVSPLNPMPWKTLFHEIAHVLLGHTAENMLDEGETTPRCIKEVEAESVAMICCASLGLQGEDYSRDYIQTWYKEKEIPEQSAQKIFKVANEILNSGKIKETVSNN